MRTTESTPPRGLLKPSALDVERALRSVEVVQDVRDRGEVADNDASGRESEPSDDLTSFFGELMKNPPPAPHPLVTPPIPEGGLTWDSSDDFFDTRDANYSTDREGSIDFGDMDPGVEIDTDSHSSPHSMSYAEEWGLSDYRSNPSEPGSPSAPSHFTSGPFLDQDCSSVSPTLSDASDSGCGHSDGPQGRGFMLTGKVSINIKNH